MELTHIDKNGSAVMVDISGKKETQRIAVAAGRIHMSREAVLSVTEGRAKKGDVLGTARIAGIMAAKRTPDLIPLCHTLMLSSVKVEFEVLPEECCVECFCTVRLTGRTGAEMEALTGVSVALLTVYDMLKAVDKTMVIDEIRLLEKDGGKTGHFVREPDAVPAGGIGQAAVSESEGVIPGIN